MRFLSAWIFLALACAVTLLGCRSISHVRIPDGVYLPDPRQNWFAGEVITVAGSKFHWGYFTDAIGTQPPDQEGRISYFERHIVLDGLKWNAKRIPATLRGVPVLWTEEGYAEWQKSGRETGVLFREKK